MSVRNGFVLLAAVSMLLFLAACGSSNNIATPVAPPSGNFSNSNLNGTYVFSVSGTDSTGDPYTLAGTITANGSSTGVITGGTLDINGTNANEFTSGPIADASINNNGSYSVTVDGRGQFTVGTNVSGLPNLTFDFVLSSSSHGLITEFDSFGTGSGTIDAQTANVTPSGSYAFSLSGASDGLALWGTVGNFTLSGTSATGLEDFNEGGLLSFTAQTLTGTVAVSSTAPSTSLIFPSVGTLTFDVFPIDGTHLKFIEMDTTAAMSGDAFTEMTSMPAGDLAFTLSGAESAADFAAGGFMVTDSTGDITSASSEDVNSGGIPASTPSFTGSYAASPTGSGRFALTNFSQFSGGSSYAAYPSSGGVLLLETDSTGITIGAAYGPASASATFATGEGYGLNLSGFNIADDSEVDDIAEFTANSGNTITGIIDENSSFNGPVLGIPLSAGTYTAPSGGRGTITATAGSSTTGTLNGGFALTFYTVDGTTFPFIETDSGQVSTGVFVMQTPSGSSAAIAKAQQVFVPHSFPRSGAKKKQK
jgi:hypothetical protein